MSTEKTQPRHDTFTVERRYKQSPERVFGAFSDPEKKRRWFAEGDGWEVLQYELDFRVDGGERSRFRFRGQSVITNKTVYFDIVPKERLVYAYSMEMDGRPFSVSLATVELHADGAGTRLVLTEQGTFLEGSDGVERRAEGTRQLLEALAGELDKAP